jgi:hypothetical protein
MGLSSTDWTAVGSIFTAVAALIALGVGVLPYRQQSRLARASALRGLVRTVLHDSQEIYDLTIYASSVISDAQIRAFRSKLGQAVTSDTFRAYFFANGVHSKNGASTVTTSFIEACLASPAYSRLNLLWNDIDRTSAELRGLLRILYHASALIIEDSQEVCYPTVGPTISHEMARDRDLIRRCRHIGDVDVLMLILSTELTRRLHEKPYKGSIDRLDKGNSFIDDLANAIRDMKDRPLLRLIPRNTTGRKIRLPSSWPVLGKAKEPKMAYAGDKKKDHFSIIAELLEKMKPQLPEAIATSLEAQLVKWQENYTHDADNDTS